MAPSDREAAALFVLPLRHDSGSGPIAAWATAGGWATGAQRVLGHAVVISDSGVMTPEEALSHVVGRRRTPSTARRWRVLIPEPPITLAKDFRRAWHGRTRAQGIDASQWSEMDVAFVWQRHEMFRRCGLNLARRLRVPLVLSVHGLHVEESRNWGTRRPGWGRLAERIGELPQLREADLVACVSDGVADAVLRRGVEESRVLVTPNGVDTMRFRPGTANQALVDRLTLKGKFVVGWSGSFRGFHGLDQALTAMRLLKEKHHDIALLLIGDGGQRAAVEARAAELGLGSVVFAGAVPYEEMPGYLNLCDAGLVLGPPTGSFHYSPVKLREYMATGLPVIAHDVGQLSTSLRQYEDALLVPRDDPEALATAIVRLRADGRLRFTLRRNGLQTAQSQLSWDRRVQDVLAALELQSSMKH